MASSKNSIESQVDELFLNAFSRYPKGDEKTRAVQYIRAAIKEAGDNKSTQIALKKEAIEDLLWALINTKEFMFNN